MSLPTILGFKTMVLESVFSLTLQSTRDGQRSDRDAPPVHFLKTLAEVGFSLVVGGKQPIFISHGVYGAQEVQSEGCDVSNTLDPSLIERSLMCRLSEPPQNCCIWPVQYLIGCHRRSMELLKQAQNDSSQASDESLIHALHLARQLSVSYTGFILQMQMFPQPSDAEERGAGQILDSYIANSTTFYAGGAEHGSLIPERVRRGTSIEAIHPEFLPDFVSRFAEDGVEDVMHQLGVSITKMMSGISILGDYGSAVGTLSNILSHSVVASHVCATEAFLPSSLDDTVEGRNIENETILGAMFGISAIPDIMENPMVPTRRRTPDVADQCFPGGAAGRQADIRTSCTTIQVSLDQLQTSIHRIIMVLLKNPDTKDRVLTWFAGALSVNKERTKMRPDMKKASTDGFMLNLCSVLLRLCRPFLDHTNGKAWSKLDVRYISDPRSRGCSFGDDTRLGLQQEELLAWTNEDILNHELSYHFICECFFLSGNALRLGVFKALENCHQLIRAAKEYDREADMAAGDALHAMRVNSMKQVAARLKSMAMCFEATMQQNDFLADFIAYYSLLASYFPRLAVGPVTSTFSLPLPSPAPKSFLSVPVRVECGF